jgi:hypothetical protein
MEVGGVPVTSRSRRTCFTVGTPTSRRRPATTLARLPVSVATTTPDATLRYRLDGGAPTETPGRLRGSVSVEHSATLKVAGFRTGWKQQRRCLRDVLDSHSGRRRADSHARPGTFTSAQSVTITTATSGAVIRYNRRRHRAGFPVADLFGGTERRQHHRPQGSSVCRGHDPQRHGRRLVRRGYRCRGTRRASVSRRRTYTTGQVVTVTSQTPGATIRYRLDGYRSRRERPGPFGSELDVRPIQRLTARAFKAGMTDSGVQRADYVLPAPSPSAPTTRWP